MKRKLIIIISICIIALIAIIVLLWNNGKDKEDSIVSSNNNLLREDATNLTEDNRVLDIIEDTAVQGIVELKRNEYIYIFNGQHFGEFGFEMEEYNSLSINNTNQKCIDYFTLEEYDTSYIEEGDLLIYKGDLKEMSNGNYSTGDSPIIVLKLNDYNKIKEETVTGKRDSEILVGKYFETSNEIYLKYNISDNIYQLPFALELKIEDDTEVIGKIKEGVKVNVQYKDLNVSLEDLELKSIEVVEN